MSTKTPVSPAPRLWCVLVRLFELDADVAQEWWVALHQSQLPGPTRWLRQLLFYDARPQWNHEPLAMARYIIRSMPPREIVQVIEGLCEGGVLSRGTATAIEDAVLVRMDAVGEWHAQVTGEIEA